MAVNTSNALHIQWLYFVRTAIRCIRYVLWDSGPLATIHWQSRPYRGSHLALWNVDCSPYSLVNSIFTAPHRLWKYKLYDTSLDTFLAKFILQDSITSMAWLAECSQATWWGGSGLVSTVCVCTIHKLIQILLRTSLIMDKLYVVVRQRNNPTTCTVHRRFTFQWWPPLPLCNLVLYLCCSWQQMAGSHNKWSSQI